MAIFHKIDKCKNCQNELDEVVFDIENGKIICSLCNFANDPKDFSNPNDVPDVIKIMLPDRYEDFLVNAGYERVFRRRTSKLSVAFLATLMALGAMITVSDLNIAIYFKAILAPILVFLCLRYIIKEYNREEEPVYKLLR